MNTQNIRKQIMTEVQQVNPNWPRLGKYLHLIIQQELCQEWGFHNFAEYLDQELKIRHAQALEIMDSADFFERHFAEKYNTILSTALPLPTTDIPDLLDVILLVKHENKYGVAHDIAFQNIVQQVFEAQIKGKDISTLLAELINHPQHSANAVPQPNTEQAQVITPQQNLVGSQSRIASRRSVWDNVSASRAQRNKTQQLSNNSSINTNHFIGSSSIDAVSDLISSFSSDNSSNAVTNIPTSNHQNSNQSATIANSTSDTKEATIPQGIKTTTIQPSPNESPKTPLAITDPIHQTAKLDSHKAITPKIGKIQIVTKTSAGKSKINPFMRWIKSQRWLRELKKAFVLSFLIGIIGVVLIVYAVIYFLEMKEFRQKERTRQEYITQAQTWEKSRQWQEAITAYQNSRAYANSDQTYEIDQKISQLTAYIQYIKNTRRDFQEICQKAQHAEDLQDYAEASACYQQADKIYQQNLELFSQDQVLEEIAKSLSFRIENNQNNYKIVTNKTNAFRQAYQEAEKATKEGRFYDAFLKYQEVYKIDSTFNPELEKKIKYVETKYRAIEVENFEKSQKEQGKIFYQNRWVTPKEKLELDGFREYNNRWVSPDLCRILKEQDENAKAQIEYLTQYIEKQREIASKVYLVVTVEGKQYRGEILDRNNQSVTLRLLFDRGSLERTFSAQQITTLEIENPTWEEYNTKFSKKNSMYDLTEMLKWAKQKKIDEVIQLAKYRIFLLDFSHPECKFVQVEQREGIWWPK